MNLILHNRLTNYPGDVPSDTQCRLCNGSNFGIVFYGGGGYNLYCFNCYDELQRKRETESSNFS